MNCPLFTSCVLFATNFMTSCCTVFSETWEEIKNEAFHFCFSACTHACKELTPLPHFICSATISFFVSFKGNHWWRPTVSFEPFQPISQNETYTYLHWCELVIAQTHKLSRHLCIVCLRPQTIQAEDLLLLFSAKALLVSSMKEMCLLLLLFYCYYYYW